MRNLFLLLILLISFVFAFAPKTYADDLYKFTNANFDTSNSIIVLSAQDTAENFLNQNIKLVKMENKAYFDIENAVTTFPKQNWIFNSGPIKERKIMQQPLKMILFLNLKTVQ